MRIPVFLAENQAAFETLLHPPAFTAQRRAKYLHVPGSRVAKSVLLAGPRGAFLAVLPATHRVDTEALARELGGPVRLGTAAEAADLFRDCEWGAVPPFGSLYGVATFLDESLNPDDSIVFEGQGHMHALRLRCRDFERLERPRRLRFARLTSGTSRGPRD
jgi:Ala-tRNA(Pro) deacylase